MNTSIGGIGASDSMQMMQSMRAVKRPDPTELVAQLFSKLDTSSQGYIEQSDLQSAFSKI